MPIPLCAECYLRSCCRRLLSHEVTADELTPAFIADVRRFMQTLGLTRDAWKPYLIDGYMRYPGLIVDAEGRETVLDTGVFDVSGIRYWFRDLLRPIPSGARPRIRRSAWTRFLVMASILRALHPVPALLWGRAIANDDEGQTLPEPVLVPGCPYPHFRTGARNERG